MLLLILIFFLTLSRYHRSGNGVWQPLDIPQKSQFFPPREVDEAVQALVQLNTTPRDEPQLPAGYVVASSQTGVVENDVYDNDIFIVSPRSSTPDEHISADVLSLLAATVSNIQSSPAGCPNSSVISVGNTPLTCLQFNDSLDLSDVSHSNTNQVGSLEHFAPLQETELPDLSSHYGLDLFGLGLAKQHDAETQTPVNLQDSVVGRVDQLTAVVNSEFAELKRHQLALEKSVSENKNLLQKQNEKLIEIVQQLRSSTAQHKEDTAAVRRCLREHSDCNASISILLDTLVQRLLS